MEKIYISASSLTKIATCETKTALSKLGYGSKGPVSAPAAVGKLMHARMAELLMGTSVDEAVRNLYREWATTFDDVPGRPVGNQYLDESYLPDNLDKVLREWCRRHLNSLPMKIEAVEKEFDEVLGTFWSEYQDENKYIEVHIIGVMDGYGESGGNTWIIEHKFTRKYLDDNFRRGFLFDPQNGAYIWAAAKLLGRPVLGSFVNAVSVRELPGSDRRCRTHAVAYAECGSQHLQAEMFPVDRPSERLALWEQETMRLAEKYYLVLRDVPDASKLSRVDMNGMFVRDACVWCDYFAFCRANRPVELIDQFLTKREDDRKIKSGIA